MTRQINPTSLDVFGVSVFTINHHNVRKNLSDSDINPPFLLSQINNKPRKLKTILEISEIIYSLIANNLHDEVASKVSLTLTGGMDSRVILACLLKAGYRPNCFVYGNQNSSDVIYAKNLCKSLGLNFQNVCQNPPNKDWYYKWVVETIKRDQGNSHLHRAHRTAAIAEYVEAYNPKVLFTGHMGGEGLRGLTYNNYFASPFFEWVNEGKMKPLDAAKKVLEDYFVRTENIDWEKLLDNVMQLPWMQHDKQTNKFYFLYDLVGKIHHAQDIRLYKTYIPEVVPVFLQKEYLETLFNSPFHFLNKKPGIWGRLQNPYVHSKLIEYIYPPLLDYPLANGFSPKDYLRGLWYVVPKKAYSNFRHKKNYPPTFSYGQWYVDFVKEHAQNVNPEIWEVYDKKRYMHALENNHHETNEGYWHKFSNPIYFDLVEKYKNGKI